ncbi:MAG TPA: carbamoyltransferase HypF [Acidimicrobiales bacterium]|nr:carbamoyltransferase HypF [Acidimicrobiales bacterium]
MATSRLAVRVQGTVQGVGFRPFVRNLAAGMGLSGHVGNDTGGVFIEVEGAPEELEAFLVRLRSEAPRLAVVERVEARTLEPLGQPGFDIVSSNGAGPRHALVTPDSATCEDCLSELFDPGDRRYRYPFINCTNCGPRFTIVRSVPYDRPNTTMAAFEMCEECRAEYEDPSDRRFHAQPTCCPQCGPVLALLSPAGEVLAGAEAALEAALRALREEKVVAIKGLGGYHLAVVASSERAASALRARKHREDKPFAVMVPDMVAGRSLCSLSKEEEALLSSPAHPIVLAPRRISAVVAPSVAPGNRFLGIMLPYTPLHHLLAYELGTPFVLTSGNRSEEPIAYRDEEALAQLEAIADVFLVHDRPVHMRTDDSVARVWHGRPMLLRRSRGYAPRPIALPTALKRPVLGCGAELKNTFCLAKGPRAFVSHHIGDLENYETLRSFREGVSHFGRLWDVEPEVLAYDLHPEYLSTKYAWERAEAEGLELVGVQHHHAHIASCLADNAELGPVIGVAFDGLGFGDDGTLWGGELLVADLAGYKRAGHLVPVPMPGGSGAIKNPWRMAASYLDLAFDGSPPPSLAVIRRNQAQWSSVSALSRSGPVSPLTSSMGRLFDALGAILAGRDSVNYEGQAAVELEQLAQLPGPSEDVPYKVTIEIDAEGSVLWRGAEIVRSAVEDLLAGTPGPVVAARFHNTVASALARGCVRVRELHGGLSSVALSGGVFQNILLSEAAVRALSEEGFRVLRHSQVPPNDGGISLGQVAVAAARLGA